MALHINPINNFLLMEMQWAQGFLSLSSSPLRGLLFYFLSHKKKQWESWIWRPRHVCREGKRLNLGFCRFSLKKKILNKLTFLWTLSFSGMKCANIWEVDHTSYFYKSNLTLHMTLFIDILQSLKLYRWISHISVCCGEDTYSEACFRDWNQSVIQTFKQTGMLLWWMSEPNATAKALS